MSLAARSQTGNKDPGRELVNFAIGFIVLQTIVLILFYASRYAKTKQISGIEMKYFMPLGYLFCISNALVSIRKVPNILGQMYCMVPRIY
jgi:hypothetical protein